MTPRSRGRRSPNRQRGRQKRHSSKIRSWTLPTVLGLVLTALGLAGLIELRPQIAVTPEPPLTQGQPFSVPFRIENTGYFPFFISRVFMYAVDVKRSRTTIKEGTTTLPDWNCFVLDRAESNTIVTKFANFMPDTADIVLVVDYRPLKSFPFDSRRYFRFVGAHGDNWQWLKEQSADIQSEADKHIEDLMKKIPSSRTCPVKTG